MPHQSNLACAEVEALLIEPDVAERAPELVALFFRTLGESEDPRSAAALERLLGRAVRGEPAFAKALAGALVQYVEKGLYRALGGNHAKFRLLRWSCLLLRASPELLQAKAAFPRLAAAQAVLLSDVMQGGRRVRRAAQNTFTRLLQEVPAAFEQYCSQLAGATGFQMCGLVFVLLGFCTEDAAGENLLTDKRKLFLDLFVKLVLASSERPPPFALSAFAPLLSRLTRDEFSATVAPAASRTLRRSPELSLGAVEGLLAASGADASAVAATQLLPPLLVQARGNDESARRSAVSGVRALAKACSDFDAVTAMFEGVKAVLGGSEGKLTAPHQKVGMLNAIHALASAPDSRAAPPLARTIASYLVSVYPEGNEDVKAANLAALGAWLARAGAKVPPEVLTLLAAGLKEKETLRRAHLRCMRAGLAGNQDLPAQLPRLADPLLQLVKTGASKPAQRLEGVYALLVLARIAALDVATEELLTKEKVWALVSQPDSPFVSPSLVGKLPLEDVPALADLVDALLVQHAARVTEQPGGGNDLLMLAVILLAHPSWDVRRIATTAVARCHAAASPSEGIAEALVHAAIEWMPLLEDRARATSRESADAIESGAKGGVEAKDAGGGVGAAGWGRAGAPPPQLLGSALASLAAPGLAARPGVCALLMLVAHHPLVVPGARKGVVWKAIVSAAKRKGADFDAALASAPDLVCKILLGPRGLLSPRPAESQAAVAAVASAMQAVPEEFFPRLYEGLLQLANRAEHDALTDREVKIYHLPEGVLSTEDGMYVAEAVHDSNVRRDRGRMKMYGEDDAPAVKKAVPAKEARTSTGSSKGSGASKKDGGKAPGKRQSDGEAAKPKSQKEEVREAQLREEAAVRLRVQALRDRVALALEALSVGAAANPGFSHARLPLLVDATLPFFPSPLVRAEACAALLRLSRCVAPTLRRSGPAIVAALALLYPAEGGSAGSSFVDDLAHPLPEAGEGDQEKAVVGPRSPLEAVVAGLVASAQLGPLSGHSFSFVFPVIERILYMPTKSRLHDALLDIVALHSRPDMELPRLRMLRVLYHTLGCVPIYKDKIPPIVQDLCSVLPPEDVKEALCGVFAKQAHVRRTCLSGVLHVPAFQKSKMPQDPDVTTALWIAMYDEEPANVVLAEDLWDRYGTELGPGYAQGLLPFLSHENNTVRVAVARALSAAMDEYPTTVQDTLDGLFAVYSRELPVVVPVVPVLGSARLSAPPPEEPLDTGWPGREGVALSLKEAADVLTPADVHSLLTFLISTALADMNPEVREKMLAAGLRIINQHGEANVATLLPICENYLSKKAVDEQRYDLVRAGVVVFLGALAKHLTGDSPKIWAIVQRMLEVLNTPSEAVQRVVSDCMPPLMVALEEKTDQLVAALLTRLMQSDKYAERKGAAFGLGGVVKGLGLPALKRYGIMDALRAGMEDKNSAKSREGALLAFECLSEKLGRVFEPYVIHILPLLLISFSDNVSTVREAAEMASRIIMGKLTAQGVRLVLPALLMGLEDKAWRTKQGSVQLLGAMSYCVPRQLSSCLPTIVPKLSEVLTDTHPKVQAAAKTALQEVGSVIRNPEIAALVPTLLVGIADPNAHTKTSLEKLLQTTFVNTVDAPSLALLVPIVHRGLRERGSDVKKKAAQIVGNMCSLVNEPTDMLPYLELLLPELKKVLVDPVPEVRTVAARALGSLVRGMGNSHFEELVPWLIDALKSETSSVERSGAAQGLSEVLAAIGTDHVEGLLPDIIANCSHARATVREGFLTLFKYLPQALGRLFQFFLSRVLPAILDGLADENESVRDAALAAGHVFVEHYALTSLPLLLPAVEAGIFHDNWRIRQSSVELLGDLLFKVAGTSGKVVLEGGSDDEGASTEAHGRAIAEVLGQQKRDEVLAALYMVRSDVSLGVRQGALHVWKTLVVNTPKTLKEIMPVLMRTLITSLASESPEQRQVAGRSLGELVRKLGDRVIPTIIPILQKGLKDDSDGTRQGVCMGLSEVMASATKQQLQGFMVELIATIRTALCDSSPEVREAAGQAFNTLYKSAGMLAVDEIVPALLAALEEPSTSETALDGLKQIISIRTTAVLPHIVPALVQPPITSFNAHALGALARVADGGLNQHLHAIIPPLIACMGGPDQAAAAAAKEAVETIATSVDEDGEEALLAECNKGLSDPRAIVRQQAAYVVGFFFKASNSDLEEQAPTFLSTLIVLLTDSDEGVVQAALLALGCVTSTIPNENLPLHIKTVRDAVSTARDRERRRRKLPILTRDFSGPSITIPGFCNTKALDPLLQVFNQGLEARSADIREQAADGVGELLEVTSVEAFQPLHKTTTGVLIRIVNDKFPWQVKRAILNALGIVISKTGAALKGFVPQLQPTFVKCLQDGARPVRTRAARALGRLMGLFPVQVDPLVSSLLTKTPSSEGGVKEAFVMALCGVLASAGASMRPTTVAKVPSVLQTMLAAEELDLRTWAARALGIAMRFLPPKELEALLRDATASSGSQPWTLRHGHTMVLAAALRRGPEVVAGVPARLAAVTAVLKTRAADDKVPVRESAASAMGRLLCHQVETKGEAGELLPVLAGLIMDESSDVRKRALRATKALAKACAGASGARAALAAAAGPPLADCLKDGSPIVKAAAERVALHVYGLTRGDDNVKGAQKYLTGLDARRIAKYSENSDASDDSEADTMAD